MLARTFAALVVTAAALAAPRGAHAQAEPEIERAIVFGAHDVGPRQDPAEAPACVAPDAPDARVLDWVSPVFVWFDEGYAYVEVTVAF